MSKKKLQNIIITFITSTIFLTAGLTQLRAEEMPAADPENPGIAVQASEALDKQMLLEPEKRIPEIIRDNAKCIAVFPQVVKMGFVIAVEGGPGVVSCRNQETGEWGAPAVYNFSATSLGFQAGVKSASIILVYMNDKATATLLKPKMTFGGDVELQAGPILVDAEADLATLPSVVSYVRSKGLFGGVKLEGGKITYLEERNIDIYNETLTPEQVLFENREIPESVKVFHDTVTKYSPSYKGAKPE